LFEDDRFGLSSLRTERVDYAAAEVHRYCFDVGCGHHNQFICEMLAGNRCRVFDYLL
jgi:hypothetical protein